MNNNNTMPISGANTSPVPLVVGGARGILLSKQKEKGFQINKEHPLDDDNGDTQRRHHQHHHHTDSNNMNAHTFLKPAQAKDRQHSVPREHTTSPKKNALLDLRPSVGYFARNGELFAISHPIKTDRRAVSFLPLHPKTYSTYQEHYAAKNLIFSLSPPSSCSPSISHSSSKAKNATGTVTVGNCGGSGSSSSTTLCRVRYFNKPLQRYDPNAVRNRLPQTFHNYAKDKSERIGSSPFFMGSNDASRTTTQTTTITTTQQQQPYLSRNTSRSQFITTYQKYYNAPWGSVNGANTNNGNNNCSSSSSAGTTVGFTNPGIVSERSIWQHKRILD